MKPPNLFNFATSELSQDAFLCWLVSWAHREQRTNDAALHETAVALLNRLLALHGIPAPAAYESLEVQRQHRGIDILVPVFLKTGDQSTYQAVKAAGFARWTGFFMALQKRLGEGEWADIIHGGRGFMGFWWHQRDDVYLQFEEHVLYVKVRVEAEGNRAARRQEVQRLVMAASKASGLTLYEPACRRKGTCMTVAWFAGEYRQTDQHGILDLDKTVVFLRRAEAILDAVAAEAGRAGTSGEP